MKVGFIGLGTMGSGMALNVLKSGHELVVHDINREARGARGTEHVADGVGSVQLRPGSATITADGGYAVPETGEG
jgi:3-hydroxyisobutyrate dehydrogenase